MRRLAIALTCCALLTATWAVVAPPGSSAATAPSYTKQTLHFKVTVGPGGAKTCDIIGDLYAPRTANPTNRVPAILTTNGFGGSKDDQAGIGRAFAARGYVVLSYSGLGFGGSGCQITLDDPDYDGAAGSQLISYLGGASGIAYLDAAHTKPAPRLTIAQHDSRAHDGRRLANDPLVGMIGGSYGGQVQFAVASVDPRLDTIVPIITWSDLSYSLGPNNTSQVKGVTPAVPGTTKLTWGLLFSTLGVVNGLEGAQTDPARLLPCPNFASFVCPALVTAGTTGYFQDAHVKALQHASVASYITKIKIPTLLMQGEGDTLFNLNEGIANYQALKAQGTPVKMIWQSWGHSDSTPAPGEIDLGSPNPTTQYETGRVTDWFNHYLKGRRVSTGPEFAYFRDWVKYSGNAMPAFGTAPSFPVGRSSKYYLSGNGLVGQTGDITEGTQTFVTLAAGLPTSSNKLDALGGSVDVPVPELDTPGTFASWDTATLTTPVAVAGAPVLRVQVSSPTAALTQAAGPIGKLVVFVRIQDVGPDGKGEDIQDLTAPVRVDDVGKPFTVTMPAFVHRFATGHRIRLVIAGGSLNYRAGMGVNTVSVTSGGTGQLLSLPVIG